LSSFPFRPPEPPITERKVRTAVESKNTSEKAPITNLDRWMIQINAPRRRGPPKKHRCRRIHPWNAIEPNGIRIPLHICLSPFALSSHEYSKDQWHKDTVSYVMTVHSSSPTATNSKLDCSMLCSRHDHGGSRRKRVPIGFDWIRSDRIRKAYRSKRSNSCLSFPIGVVAVGHRLLLSLGGKH